MFVFIFIFQGLNKLSSNFILVKVLDYVAYVHFIFSWFIW